MAAALSRHVEVRLRPGEYKRIGLAKCQRGPKETKRRLFGGILSQDGRVGLFSAVVRRCERVKTSWVDHINNVPPICVASRSNGLTILCQLVPVVLSKKNVMVTWPQRGSRKRLAIQPTLHAARTPHPLWHCLRKHGKRKEARPGGEATPSLYRATTLVDPTLAKDVEIWA